MSLTHLLAGAGPVQPSARVRAVLGEVGMSHLDPAFLAEHRRALDQLRLVLGVRGGTPLCVSGGGSFAMEATVRSLSEPGDAVLVVAAGTFGLRIAEMARLSDCQVDVLRVPRAAPSSVELVRRAFARRTYKALLMVHGETSAGVMEDVEAVAEIARGSRAVVILDVVSTAGGVPLELERWGVDAAFSAAHKCLGTPPGLGLVWLSERALARLAGRSGGVPWGLDLRLMYQALQRGEAAHYTPSVSLIRALCASLDEILEEGLPRVFARHAEVYARLALGCEAQGLVLPVPSARRLPTVSVVEVVRPPPHALREALARRHGIVVSPGLDELREGALRIGLMGATATVDNAARVTEALRDCVAASTARVRSTRTTVRS